MTLNYGWPGAIQPGGGWPGAIQPEDGPEGPPAAPTNLVATAVGSDVQLTWDKTADGGQVEIWRRRL